MTTIMDLKTLHQVLAQEVMGWPLVQSGVEAARLGEVICIQINQQDQVEIGMPYRFSSGMGRSDCIDHSWRRWRPTVLPKDAKMVIQAMAKHGFLAEIKYRDLGDGRPDAWASFRPRLDRGDLADPDVIFRGMGDDIEPAVCLAALHWRGYTVDPSLYLGDDR